MSFSNRLLSKAISGLALAALSGGAEAATTAITEQNRTLFAQVYQTIASLDGIVAFCHDARADVAVDHQAIVDDFNNRHGLDQARPVAKAVAADQPEITAALDQEIEAQLAGLKEVMDGLDICGALFADLVDETETPDVRAFMEAFADGVDLSDVIETPTAVEQAATEQSPAEDEEAPAGVVETTSPTSAEPIVDAEIVTITDGNLKTFTGMNDAVGSIDWFNANCAEAAPASVAQNQEILAGLVPAEALAGTKAFLARTLEAQPDLREYADGKLQGLLANLEIGLRSQMAFLCEQQFATIATPFTENVTDAATFSQALASTADATPVETAARQTADSQPQTGENIFIYAKEPIFVPNPYHMYWKAEVLQLTQGDLQTKGVTPGDPLDDYRYVEPLPDDTRISGWFETFGGGQYGHIKAFAAKSLTFAEDGRFTTHANGTFNEAGRGGQGRYHISGYTLELVYDDGKVDRLPFFGYRAGTFWPKSDKPGDHIAYLNVGDRIYYPGG